MNSSKHQALIWLELAQRALGRGDDEEGVRYLSNALEAALQEEPQQVPG